MKIDKHLLKYAVIYNLTFFLNLYFRNKLKNHSRKLQYSVLSVTIALQNICYLELNHLFK